MSPQLAFDTLFGSFVPPTSGGTSGGSAEPSPEAVRQELLNRQKRSILDLFKN